jgi:hypothetical protein
MKIEGFFFLCKSFTTGFFLVEKSNKVCLTNMANWRRGEVTAQREHEHRSLGLARSGNGRAVRGHTEARTEIQQQEGKWTPLTIRRNSYGCGILAAEQCIGSALDAEAEAVRAGVQMLANRSMHSVIVETGSKQLVNPWKSRQQQRSSIMQILPDIQNITSSSSLFFLNKHRKANIAADCCAKAAYMVEVGEWQNQPPLFLCAACVTDRRIVTR